jgi:hypothetical protein
MFVEVASAQHEIDSPVRQQVKRCVLLGHPDGIVVGAKGNGGADSQRGGPFGDGGQQHRWRREDVVAKVMLAD